jgi:hypothetical protein
MTPVASVAQVYEEIQSAKAAATAFCTNFYPAQDRLQGWVDHRELRSELHVGATIFLRQDQDFARLYFCAANPDSLRNSLGKVREIASEPLVTDLIAPESGFGSLAGILEASGFRSYRRLVRLARAARTEESLTDGPKVELASSADTAGIARLLLASFDPVADQLPAPYELEAAVRAGQIFVIRKDGEIGALLHFETQGVTSTVRYWAVADACRSAGFGSAVIRHYFCSQTKVRRFVLWVSADNENALQKYRHYGYAPDGLVDRVLVNHLITK